MTLTLHVLGEPIAKQGWKSRVAGTPGRQFVQTYRSAQTKSAHNNLRAQLIAQLPEGFTPLAGPLIVHELVFAFPPLKSMPKGKQRELAAGRQYPKATKPDLDNLEKLLWDAAEGILYLNDSQICEKRQVRKVYGQQPGIRLVIGEACGEEKFNNSLL